MVNKYIVLIFNENMCRCEKFWYNGTILPLSHTREKDDNYLITAKVKDLLGKWSE